MNTKDRKTEDIKTIDNKMSGLSIAIGFSLLGLYITSNEGMFYYPLIRLIILIVVGCIGTIGILIESTNLLQEILKDKYLDTTNLAVGLALFIFLYGVSFIKVKIPMLIFIKDFFASFFIILAFSATIDGFTRVVNSINKGNIKYNLIEFLKSFFRAIVTLVGLASTLITIILNLQKFL